MSTELTYNLALEMLPLYALGALEPEDMLAMDAYIHDHRDLLARLCAIEEAAAQLAYAAPDAPLPDDARQRLLARVQADLASAGAQPAVQTPSRQGAAPRLSDAPRTPARTQPRLRAWLAGLSRRAVLGGALAALLVGVYVGQVQARLSDLTGQITTMHDVVVTLREQVQENQAVIGRLVDQNVQLAGTARAPGASASFYVNESEGVLVARGLDPLPPTQTYQLWLVIDGKPTPFGLFQIQPGITAVLTVQIPASAQHFAIVDVSIEPAGGSQAITKETIVLRGSVD